MKAIVVRQPWATLIALGIKTIETRPAPPNGPMRPDGVRGLPGLAMERGERIAIVAGADPSAIRGYGIELCTPGIDRSMSIAIHGALHHHGFGLDWASGSTFTPLPLSAVVCTAVVADTLPILGRRDELDLAWRHHIAPSYAHGLALWRTAKAVNLDTYWSVSPITDQLPLGDFTPGRWGWMLTDVQPCDPIPCKGQQGVFQLPHDVAERVRGEG